jgi:hypothetical protein
MVHKVYGLDIAGEEIRKEYGLHIITVKTAIV